MSDYECGKQDGRDEACSEIEYQAGLRRNREISYFLSSLSGKIQRMAQRTAPDQSTEAFEAWRKTHDIGSYALDLDTGFKAGWQAARAAEREAVLGILKRWVVDANEGRIKNGMDELYNKELALIGDVLRCVAGDIDALSAPAAKGAKEL